jgi:hypothetical protein
MDIRTITGIPAVVTVASIVTVAVIVVATGAITTGTIAARWIGAAVSAPWLHRPKITVPGNASLRRESTRLNPALE